MDLLSKPFSYALLVAALFSLISLAHSISVYSYFGGPPPTADFEKGQVIMTLTSVLALLTCTFALFVLQMDLKSVIISITINTFFALSILLSFFVFYYFRTGKPGMEKFHDYTATYFKVHGQPPPFLDKIQRQMGGRCCGGQSYLDYVKDESAEFFNVPHSCCFSELRRRNSGCGQGQWKYLYLYLFSIMDNVLTQLETLQYSDLDDLAVVQKKLSLSEAPTFLQSHKSAIISDRIASIKKNMSQARYNQIQNEEWENNRQATGDQLAAKISQRIYDEAMSEVYQLNKQIINSVSIFFVPLGCWTLMDELRTSNWKGFDKFKILRDKIRSIFHGVLAMSILHFFFILLSALIFNYYTYFQGVEVSGALEDKNEDNKDPTVQLSHSNTLAKKRRQLKRRSAQHFGPVLQTPLVTTDEEGQGSDLRAVDPQGGGDKKTDDMETVTVTSDGRQGGGETELTTDTEDDELRQLVTHSRVHLDDTGDSDFST